jgi:anti-sigma factor (TIGR02949 family)
MDCGEIADHLSPLADEELEREKADRVRAHLTDCPRCNRHFQNLLHLKRRLPEILPFETSPPGLRSAILDRLEASSRNDFLHAFFSRLRAQPFLASAVGVTVFLALFASALWFVHSRSMPPLIREVLFNHTETYQPPLEFVSADASRLTRELSLRMRKQVEVPGLKECTPMGFRQCPLSGKSAVEIRYGHRQAILSLFIVPEMKNDEVKKLCNDGCFRKKEIDGKMYGYCEAESCGAVFWSENGRVVVVTSTLGTSFLFDVAGQIRRSYALEPS